MGEEQTKDSRRDVRQPSRPGEVDVRPPRSIHEGQEASLYGEAEEEEHAHALLRRQAVVLAVAEVRVQRRGQSVRVDRADTPSQARHGDGEQREALVVPDTLGEHHASARADEHGSDQRDPAASRHVPDPFDTQNSEGEPHRRGGHEKHQDRGHRRVHRADQGRAEQRQDENGHQVSETGSERRRDVIWRQLRS